MRVPKSIIKNGNYQAYAVRAVFVKAEANGECTYKVVSVLRNDGTCPDNIGSVIRFKLGHLDILTSNGHYKVEGWMFAEVEA